MKFLRIAAAAVALFAAAATPVSAAETLKVGTECTYFPFNFKDADGNLKGYDVDVAREIGSRIGAEIEFVCQEWKGMIPALLAGKFDLIVASMSITEERKKQIDFSGAYRVSIGQFIGPKAKQLKLFNEDGSVNADGFNGMRIGLERSSTYEKWLKAKVPAADVAYYDNNESMYLDLAAGRVDAIMTNPMKAYLSFISKPDGAGFEVVGPQLEDEAHFGTGVGVGLRKDQPELLGRINGALEAITKEGKLKEFSLRYFPFTINPQNWQGT